MEKSPDSETYKDFNRLRNLVNRRLREAHHNFFINSFQKLPTNKKKRKFIKQKISPSDKKCQGWWNQIRELWIFKGTKNIVYCLNRSIANLGVFKGSDIACRYPDKTNVPEFTIRTVTRKKLYSVIDSLDDNKAAGPGEISIWLNKFCKLAIGVHLQFALIKCIKEKVLQTKMKLAYVTPFFKKRW